MRRLPVERGRSTPSQPEDEKMTKHNKEVKKTKQKEVDSAGQLVTFKLRAHVSCGTSEDPQHDSGFSLTRTHGGFRRAEPPEVFWAIQDGDTKV